MSYSETPVIFPCAGDKLVGVMAAPASPPNVGVLIIVGGPQYRVGSQRQFLLLARRLANEGFATFRFDYRGMGDSTGLQRDFQSIEDDINSAIVAFQEACPVVSKIMLWGLCDAASAAMLYWYSRHDVRVNAMCLLNPWVRSEATYAKTLVKYYYGRRLVEKQFWLSVIRGRVRIGDAAINMLKQLWQARFGFFGNRQEPSFQVRMAWAVRSFPGAMLFILSGQDYTAREFLECAASGPEWAGCLSSDRVKIHKMPGADHTFSRKEWRGEVEEITLGLLREVLGLA